MNAGVSAPVASTARTVTAGAKVTPACDVAGGCCTNSRRTGSIARAVALKFLPKTLAEQVAAQAAAAPKWKPDKRAEIIVTTAPGGGNDKVARLLQKIMQEHKLVELSPTVVNKPGGSGVVAMSYLNSHAGDGHFLAITSVTFLAENINGMRVVTAYNRQEENLSTFNELQDLTPLNNVHAGFIIAGNVVPQHSRFLVGWCSRFPLV